MLLLQSAAIWHDVSHPFHVQEAQCDTLHAIQHTPFADTTAKIHIHVTPLGLTDLIPVLTQATPSVSFASPHIRAPPFFV
jgi:hypothetical protein